MRHPTVPKPELLRWLQMLGDADRRLLAQSWSLSPHDDSAAMAKALLDPERVQIHWEQLSDDERAALSEVLRDGAVPVAILERRWGAVRDPARFANPRAYLQALDTPATTTERLYMMGLLVRGQDERGQVYRVLNDFVALLPTPAPRDRTLPVEVKDAPAEAQQGPLAEVERTLLALLMLSYDGALHALDDGALNAASLRKVIAKVTPGGDGRGIRREANWPWMAFLRTLATEAGLVRRSDGGDLHVTAQAMQWLQKSEAGRVGALIDAWIRSDINELTLWAGLTWRTPPLSLRLPASRRTVLDLLATLPAEQWVALEDVVAAIEKVEPEFLRRDGRYDTWLLYDEHNKMVSGQQHWWRVEGCFIENVVVRPLHWLGLIELSADEPCLMRLTSLGAHLIKDAPAPSDRSAEPLVVQATFDVICPPDASLLARFQLGRIAELKREDAATIYTLTRRSVLRATERGIGPDNILRFLEQHSRGGVPQAVASYIREWGGQAGRLRLEEAALLRSDDPVRLVELRRVRDLPPIEELTPLAWGVAPGDVTALLDQLDRAGFSVQSSVDDPCIDGSPFTERDLKVLVTAALVYGRICDAYDQPNDVTAAMLARLRKLIPSRDIANAQQRVGQIMALLGEPPEPSTGANTSEGETDA